jgi:hypothetical protein
VIPFDANSKLRGTDCFTQSLLRGVEGSHIKSVNPTTVIQPGSMVTNLERIVVR